MSDGWLFVDTEKKLDRARREIGAAATVGIDTEYDSLRYFREKLCLIQISTPEFTYLIDPLDSLDISFIGEVCGDPRVVKVLHAGVNDIRLMNRDFGFTFTNIFDTERAGAILGSARLSLSSLLEDFLGVALSKRKHLQRSRWDRRPLTGEQLSYASQDTIYLIELYNVLMDLLVRARLEEKARTSFSAVAAARWSDKKFDPRGYMRVRGADDLDDRGRRCLQRLYRWRFHKARKTDKPRFMLVSDHDLVALAGSDVSTIEDLAGMTILSPQKVAQFGAELVGLLAETDGT
ncbi:MAG: HRDC domain-containing protein [Deltaproteobacteria bacterium]|nr:HRDC domain-containing protein [Deltaproteobacteria bacterium]